MSRPRIARPFLLPVRDDFAGVPPEWPHGLVGVGGTLDPDLLLEAYRVGVFPWSSVPQVTWWSPDPRAIFELATWTAHRSIGRSARRAGWTYTVDRDFAGVMRACAEPTPARPTTWISADFVAAYAELHRRGVAHSVEVWEGAALVGGLYGVAIGGWFGGESMFHRRTDASKAALAHTVAHLRQRGFLLFDAQAPNPHLARLGVTTISRRAYLARLREAVAVERRF